VYGYKPAAQRRPARSRPGGDGENKL